jgi:hypothetical protein
MLACACCAFELQHYPSHTAGALMQSEGEKLYKLIVGPAQQATWYGHWPTNGSFHYANGSSGTGKLPPYTSYVDCWPSPCLYELTSDESEHVDLAKEEPAVFARMMGRFKELEGPGNYHPPKQNPPNGNMAELCAVIEKNGGFLRPWK